MLHGNMIALRKPLASFRISARQWIVRLFGQQAEQSIACHRVLQHRFPDLLPAWEVLIGNSHWRWHWPDGRHTSGCASGYRRTIRQQQWTEPQVTNACGPKLTYESLEKVAIGKPVDRLDYISSLCARKTVLDIGCYDETALEKLGTEHWLHGRILQRATEVIGIDISDKLPPEGLVTGSNGRILQRDAAGMDLQGITADAIQVVVAGEFIEHLEHPMAFLREVRQKLPGREFVLSTPNGVCFANALMGTIGREVQHPDHLHNFTFKTLNTMCLRAGFDSWEIVPYRFYATEMILASSGARRMLVRFVQACIRVAERVFPLLSFGYVVHIRV